MDQHLNYCWLVVGSSCLWSEPTAAASLDERTGEWTRSFEHGASVNWRNGTGSVTWPVTAEKSNRALPTVTKNGGYGSPVNTSQLKSDDAATTILSLFTDLQSAHVQHSMKDSTGGVIRQLDVVARSASAADGYIAVHTDMHLC